MPQPFNQPQILVVGAGAVGGFYGAKLAQAGARVSLVSRSDYEPVKAGGLRIRSIAGDFTFRPERVLRRVEECPAPPDFILVAVKALPEIDVPGLIRKAVGAETAVFLLQNGIEVEPPLARAFPDNELISGLAFVCLSRPAPAVVLHQCFGRVCLGRYPIGTSPGAQVLHDLFVAAGVPCDVSEDIVTDRWRKLLWNAAFNPISVLTGGADTAKIMAQEDIRYLVRKVMEEVRLIAEAEGHVIPAEAIEQNIEDTVKMAPFQTSMLQDFEAGRPMEIEAILGAPLQVAKRRGLSVPYLETLYPLMKMVALRESRSPV